MDEHQCLMLDKNSLGTLRRSYRSSLNLLLRREAREFSNELRASIKVPRNVTFWLDGPATGQNANSPDTFAVSDAYAKMLTIFIPLMVDESSFLAHFMCFEVGTLDPPVDDNDDLGIADIDKNESSSGQALKFD